MRRRESPTACHARALAASLMASLFEVHPMALNARHRLVSGAGLPHAAGSVYGLDGPGAAGGPDRVPTRGLYIEDERSAGVVDMLLFQLFGAPPQPRVSLRVQHLVGAESPNPRDLHQGAEHGIARALRVVRQDGPGGRHGIRVNRNEHELASEKDPE